MDGLMTWLNSWWQGLEIIEQILYCIAIPSTLILFIEMLMMIVGGAHGGEGVNPSDTSGIDFDGDVGGMHGDFHFDGDGCVGDIHDGTDIHLGHEHDAGSFEGDGHSHDGSSPSDMPALKLFTVQGTVAFLTMFGWVSLICFHGAVPVGLSLVIGFVAGFIVMYLMAKLFQSFKKLVQNGTLDYRNALGKEATVYIPIPPKSGGSGKVNIVIQGSLRECEAVNEGSETIPTGAGVRVIDVIGDALVVERI